MVLGTIKKLNQNLQELFICIDPFLGCLDLLFSATFGDLLYVYFYYSILSFYSSESENYSAPLRRSSVQLFFFFFLFPFFFVRIILVFALTFLLIALIIIRILIFFINILHHISKFIDFTLLSLVYFLFLSFSFIGSTFTFGQPCLVFTRLSKVMC